MAFTIEAFQNRHLAAAETRVDAILSISSSPSLIPSGERVVGFIIDKSGSMAKGRMEAVKRAVSKAIDMLADGTRFFVVAFDGNGYVVVPETIASATERAAAARKIDEISASGGTAMSAGLAAARAIFGRASNAIRHAIFLTDGKNEGEKSPVFLDELARCEGVFECDCWGVGTDWQVGEVQAISRALLGTASLIPSPEDMEAAFRGAIARAVGKALKDARLRLWTPLGAGVVFIKQVNPRIEDLTKKARIVSPQVREYATGSWASGEVREYHVAIDVPLGKVGDETLACRPSMVYRAASAEEREDKAHDARVIATWTDDATLASHRDAHVAHYRERDELAAAIRAGLELRERGNDAAATQLLGRAVHLAHASDDVEMKQRLARVVDVIDASNGTVRLRRNVKKAVTMDLELSSGNTLRLAKRPTDGA